MAVFCLFIKKCCNAIFEILKYPHNEAENRI